MSPLVLSSVHTPADFLSFDVYIKYIIAHFGAGVKSEMMHRHGDMMHLLRKYDVARFTRNDAMFAIKCGEATHH